MDSSDSNFGGKFEMIYLKFANEAKNLGCNSCLAQPADADAEFKAIFGAATIARTTSNRMTFGNWLLSITTLSRTNISIKDCQCIVALGITTFIRMTKHNELHWIISIMTLSTNDTLHK